ncbi:MAG: hypothetical protein JNG88_03910 [Phycisphaerales bacterium]|nr:hypothetical protein [Phycisphaerales bacterium]
MRNPREKTLAILVGLVVIGGLGYQFVNWAVVQPIITAQKNLKTATERRDVLAAKVQARSRTEKEWAGKASLTLALSGKDAGHRFSRDIEQLLDHAGLSEGRSIAVLAEQRTTSGFIEQPVSISVKGSVDELARFLDELYRRPYPVRIRNLSVNPEEQPGGAAKPGSTPALSNRNATASRDRKPPAGNAKNGEKAAPANASNKPERPARGSSGAADTRVVINLTATTLAIPAFKAFKHGALGDDPSAWPEGPLRLARDRDAYAAMASANQFSKWRPPPPTPDPPVTTRPVASTNPAHESKPIVKVDPRKDADKKVVVGVTSLYGERYAYVRDDASREGATERIRASEPIDDGTLLLVHPHGLVVRVLREDGQHSGEDPPDTTATIDYWYPLGKSFKDREEFHADSHPEVAAELARVSDI